MLATNNDSRKQQQGVENSYKATIEFGLFPGRLLRVIHLETNTARKKDDDVLIDPRFTIIQAKWIISLNQVVAAATAALIREHHHLAADEEDSSKDLPGGYKTPRGIALDTVVCLGGSLNETSVLNSFRLASSSNASQSCLVFGFDCTEEEMENYIKSTLGGEDDTTITLPLSNLYQPKNEIELKEIIKAYKISPTEWNSTQQHQLLEQSIINRIATKHIV
jgi:hypothetical protein